MKIQYKELRIYKYELLRSFDGHLKLSAPMPINHRYPTATTLETKFYDLHSSGHFRLKAGFPWDGPSGPTVDTESFMRASAVHDMLYKAIRDGQLPMSFRKAADKALYRICREDGMGLIRASYTYRCVRLFGKSSAMPD